MDQRKIKARSEKQNIFVRHRISIVSFVVLIVYGLVVVRRCALPKVMGLCYYYHCVDFSLGFCSKFLPGTIYNLFVRTPSPESATVYESILLGLLYIIVSVMLERLVLSLPEKYSPVLFLLTAFYLTGPATFAPYIYKLGMPDVYWLLATVPFMLLLQKRWARWVLPVFFVFAVMIHFGVLLNYVPFFALLILYELTRAKEKFDRRQLTAVFLAGIVFAVGTFVYFGFNDKNNVKVDIEEFNQLMESRGVEKTNYFDNALFRNSALFKDGKIDEAELREAMGIEDDFVGAPNEPLFPNDHGSIILQMVNSVVYEFQIHFYLYTHSDIVKHTFSQFFFLSVVLFPVCILFLRIFVRRFREAKGQRLDRFLYFCLIVYLPIASVGSLFVSTDSTRWVFHGFTVLFTFMLYLVYREKAIVLDALTGLIRRIPGFAICFYYLIYFFTVLDPFV